MVRLGIALGVLAAASGCDLYFGDHGTSDDGPPPDASCVAQPGPGRTFRLVDPSTLMCTTFNFDDGSTCGPGPGGRAGPPDWGACDSPCHALDEAGCEASASCRVARDWTAYYENRASFIACYPLDTDSGPPLGAPPAPCSDETADSCAARPECTALYEPVLSDCESCPDFEFQQCIPELQAAGTCDGPTTCDIAAPACPAGTTAGIAGGCYSGSCIPAQFCPPSAG